MTSRPKFIVRHCTNLDRHRHGEIIVIQMARSKLIKTKVPVRSKSISSKSKSKNKAMKVTICGAGGQVGQTLSLMLKQSPFIDELALYDTIGISGMAAELAHVDTLCKVSAHSGIATIPDALTDAKIVVVVAAQTKTSHFAYSSMFEANACIIQEIVENFALYSPQAHLAIATNPINSLVPLASEILKQNAVYNRDKVFGVTALNVVRANTFVAEVLGLEPQSVVVPVVGGHIDKTIIPVLSQARPCNEFTVDELENLTNSIQNAHHTIVTAKHKSGGYFACGFAIARFVLSLVKSLRGQNNIVECAYVRSDVDPNSKYLATPLLLGKRGIARNLGLPKLSEYETCQLENSLPLLREDIKKGELFAGAIYPVPCDPCDADPKARPCPPDWCKMNTD